MADLCECERLAGVGRRRPRTACCGRSASLPGLPGTGHCRTLVSVRVAGEMTRIVRKSPARVAPRCTGTRAGSSTAATGRKPNFPSRSRVQDRSFANVPASRLRGLHSAIGAAPYRRADGAAGGPFKARHAGDPLEPPIDRHRVSLSAVKTAIDVRGSNEQQRCPASLGIRQTWLRGIHAATVSGFTVSRSLLLGAEEGTA
jgi:hypothetical protein